MFLVCSFTCVAFHCLCFLVTLPLGFSWVLFPHLQWFVHWGLLLRLPWRTWVCPSEGKVWRWCSCWVTGVLAAPGPQGSWQLGQQEIPCSRRAWQQYWPTHSSVLSWRTPSLTEKTGRPQATGSQSWTRPKGPCVPRRKTSFACGSSAPVRLSVKVVQLLGLQGHGLPPPQGLCPYQNPFFEPLVAGDQMASLASLSP